MSYRVEWDDDAHTILVQTYEGKFTIEDLYAVVKITRDMIEEAGHRVDLIIDYTPSSGAKSLNILPHSTHIMKNRHPNEGIVIIVGNQTDIKPTVGALKVVRPKLTGEGRVARTVEEARKMIKALRTSS